MEESRIIIGSSSNPGTHRERNEDLVYHSRSHLANGADAYILAVADGMGGYDRGDVASRMAVDTIVERFSAADTDDVVLMLKQAYRKANESIYEDGSAHGEHNMMGTTLVTAIVNGTDATIANVGDSRAYLLRAGTLNQVTEDHSLIAEQVRMGVITQAEADHSQHKNIITRALGHRPRVDVDIFELTLLPEDRLLLSSDGVHDFLSVDTMREILSETDPEGAPRVLIERALAAGSTDNLTALVAWMAPLSALETHEPELAPVAGPGAGSVVLSVFILVTIVVLVAIIAIILLV